MPQALIVEIFGDAKQFAAELDKAAGKTRQFGRVAGLAGLALGGLLAFGLEKSAKAAMEGQADQARLDAALQTTHQSVKAMAPALEEAEAASRKLGFADNDTRLSLARLEVATGSTKKATSDLALAEDISRLKKVDLATATQTLTSTLGGNARAAKSLGIILMPVTSNMDALKEKYKLLGESIPVADKAQASFLDKQATAQKAIAAVTEKVKGQAAAYADTAQGGMAKFQAETQRLEEVFGNLLLPAITAVSEKLATFAQFLSEHTTTAEVLGVALAALSVTLIAISIASTISAAAAGIATAATAAWTAAQWLLNVALDANPIGIVVIAIAALVAGIVLAYEHSATFRAIVTGALNAVKAAANDVLDFFRDNWKTIALLISGPFLPLVVLATNAFGIRSALIDAFHAILSTVTSVVDTIVGAVTRAFHDTVAAITGAVGSALGAASSVGHAILSGVENGMAGIGTGIAQAFNAVVAFMRSVPGRIVDALGDLSGLLFNAGSAIIGGLISGLTSRLGEVEHLAGSIAGKIASLKGPIEYDRTLLVPHGQAIIEGLRSGMESGLPGLYGSVSGIAPSIGASLGGAGGGSGGGGNLTINVAGSILTENQLVDIVRKGLLRTGRRNVKVGLA